MNTYVANLLSAVKDPKCTREIMAGLYADCIRNRAGIDWCEINTAVASRWKGLVYIKRAAWKIVSGQEGKVQK